MIGKWHLGNVNESWCPWGRGFDSYVGYRDEGYYNHGAGGFCDWHLCGFFGNAASAPSP